MVSAMRADWMVSAATRRGDRDTNQDQIVVVDGAVGVLDGATSWLPQDPAHDGGWYARMLGGALADRLPGPGVPLVRVLSEAIAEVAARFALGPEHSPYSTAALVRWTSLELEALVLGDSPVVVEGRDGSIDSLLDDRLEPVGADIRASYRAHLRDGHGFDARLDALVASVQRVERTRRNQDDGFWVAGAQPDAAAHAFTRTWPIDEVRTVVVMSDGAAAAAAEYGLFGWSELVDRVRSDGPAAVLEATHRAEESDKDGVRWPRTKRHDDKSVVVVSRAED